MGLKELLALPQVSPDEWGATEPYDDWANRQTNQVFVHWGGTAVDGDAADGDVDAEVDVLLGWERYHKGKGWDGLAYDWAIGNSGALYRVRGDARSGATGGDIDIDGIPNNVEAEAFVMIIGSGQTASPEAMATLQRALEALGYDRDETYGHRESAEQGQGTVTSCPGDELIAHIEHYRKTGQLMGKDTPKGESKPAPKPKKRKTKKTWQQEVIDDMDTVDLRNVSNRRSSWVRGEDVGSVQVLLVARGYAPDNTIRRNGTVDKIGGARTKAALGKFQSATGTGKAGTNKPDYIVGPKTWRALLNA